MNVVRRIAMAIAGVVVVALAAELVAPKAMHAAQSVLATIANTSANPVPTVATDTRNVNVANTPSVSVASGTVAVSSLPAVAIGGTVNATVTNTSANPVLNRDADNPAREAFQAHIQMQPVSGGGEVQEGTVDVPSATADDAPVKELVIEEVSGECAGGPAGVDVITAVNGARGDFFFAVTSSGVLPAQSVRLYADAGTEVLVGTESGVTNCFVVLSGYLVTR